LPGPVDQIRAYLDGLLPGQRRLLYGALAIAALFLVGVAFWGMEENGEVIYRSTDAGDVQDVSDALAVQKIPHEITRNGLGIRVDNEHLGRARIAGAAAGKVEGFELLSAIELGTSPQRERWTYQRAREGELQKTINSLEETEWSRVHLVLPERSAFLRDERPPSASITVKLRPGAVLTRNQINGIRALVSGAVEGLRPVDVVLVDHDGNLLAGGEEEGSQFSGAPSLMNLRAAEERRTRGAILDSLTRVLGSPNDVTVGVTVDVETATVARVTRSQDPETQVLISETVREEKSDSTRPGGVPGAESNLPEETAGNAVAASKTSSESLEQRSNFEYTEVEERESEGPGRVKRVSVGVVVNSERIATIAKALVTAGEDGVVDEAAVEAKVKVLQKQVEETVRVAMGFNDEREDSLNVTFLPFSANAAEDPDLAEVGWSAQLAQNQAVVAAILIIMLSLILVFVVIRPLVSAVTRAAAPPAPLALETEGASLLGDVAGADQLYAGMSPEEAAQREASRNLTERLRSMVDNFENVDAADLNRLVDLEQEATAQVLRRWIRDS
jgi:flagellar M-ring protein FliF